MTHGMHDLQEKVPDDTLCVHYHCRESDGALCEHFNCKDSEHIVKIHVNQM